MVTFVITRKYMTLYSDIILKMVCCKKRGKTKNAIMKTQTLFFYI